MTNEHILSHILGKRIIGTITTNSKESPNCRLFLAFDDDTYLELYGSNFKVAGGVDKGSLEDIVRYAEKQPGATICANRLEGSDKRKEEETSI